MDKRAKIEKCGVCWIRKFKNGREGLKISLNKVIYVAFKNTKKKPEDLKMPDYVIVRFLDEPREKESVKKLE